MKKNDEKETPELKKIFIHYLDKRNEIMKKTQFNFKDVFGDIFNKETFSPKQITKLNSFLAKIM